MNFLENDLLEKKVVKEELHDDTCRTKIIYQNLSKINPDIVIQDGEVRIYSLKETKGNSISLQSLTMALNHTFKRDPEFQRESDEHKKKTPHQIVVDYLTGQFMGYISCYVYENTEKPKLVIDGKHRLTHLENFLKGDLVLKEKEASQFWSKFTPFLIKSSDVWSNKILKSLVNHKSVPNVKYTDFPDFFKSFVTSNVNIDVYDISVKCTDENGNPQKPDENKVIEIYYRKFLRINQNSANMKPEDIIWGCGSEYNVTSRSMRERSNLFSTMFEINDKDPKQQRKLNEILFFILLMLDGRAKWGSGVKPLSGKINNPEYFDMLVEGEAKIFSNIYKNQIIPNFNNYFRFGNNFEIPKNMKGIESKGTNIKYMIYFMYMIHKMGNKLGYALYEDKLPTIFLKKIIENGSKIISESIKNKDGQFLISEELTEVYQIYPDIFNNLNAYRSSTRDKIKELDPVMEKLVNVCCFMFNPNYKF